MISAFVKLLFACAQITSSEVDVVGELPVEVSSTILRYLDPESLVNAASVSRRWKSVCKSDVILRKKIHKRLRQERRARIEAYMKPSKSVRIVRQQNVPTVQFGVRNGNVSIQKLPVWYEAPKQKKKSEAKQFTVSRNMDGSSIKKLRSIPKMKNNKVSNNNIVSNIRNIRL